MQRNLNTNKCNSRRISIVFFTILFSYFCIFFKLFNIQILQHSFWKQQAVAQHMGSIQIPAERGVLYSYDESPLALNTYTYNLVIDPSKVSDKFEDLEDLFKVVYSSEFNKKVEDRNIEFLANKRKEWESIIKNNDRLYGILEKNVSYSKKKEIEKVDVSYISFSPIPARTYPDYFTYSHILGFVGKDSEGNEVGYYGVEGYYNGDLKGINGISTQEISAGGSPILFGNFESVKPVNGSSLKLTIDRTIQSFTYSTLKQAVNDYGAESGTVVIVQPDTGRILSMVNYPSYNPTQYARYETIGVFTNKAISSLYEPGSVIKALTMAAAIDLGLVNPNTKTVDNGTKSYSGHIVDNWDKKHHGEITMTQVLQLSNNIGAAWVGEKVGRKNLYEYFKKFNLGSKTGIDLEGEEAGSLRDYNQWQDIDLAAASFGQGISATPLQVTMAFSAIANGGVLMKPYIVEEIIQDDKVVVNKPTVLGKVISEESANTMVKMLTDAVSGGEAKYFVSKEYYVAGKTGTAQIAEEGEYLKDSANATFVGFLPTYKEFVMLVKLEKPKTSIYASETAVPLWMTLAEKLSTYMGLPPDKYE